MKRTHSEKLTNGYRHFFDDGSYMDIFLKGVGDSTYEKFSEKWKEQRQAIRNWIIEESKEQYSEYKRKVY